MAARPDSLTDMVFDAIKDAIVSKALPPGSQISESRLAAQLNVSKTPVRETLLRLRQVGLVEPAGRGLRVIMPSADTVRDAYELRAGLERAAVGYVVSRATAAERDEIRDAADATLACATDRDTAGFRHHDEAFHRLIARASHNPLLAAAINDSLVLTRALCFRDAPGLSSVVACAEEHVRVARAILDGDRDTAAAELDEHISHAMAMVLDSLPPQL